MVNNVSNPPTLKSKRISLRPVNPDDNRTLFFWHSNPANLHLWWADRRILSFDDFVEDFRRRQTSQIHTVLMIDAVIDDTKQTIGMVYNYNTNWVDRYTYLCVYLSPEHTAKGFGPEAGYVAAEYFFAYFGFRKLYAEVFGYNEASLKALKRHGFEQEGCLKEHRWFGDRYWDLHLLALTTDEFKTRVAPIRD